MVIIGCVLSGLFWVLVDPSGPFGTPDRVCSMMLPVGANDPFACRSEAAGAISTFVSGFARFNALASWIAA
ncbi:hypothetical protein [Leifsonia xyli]|uniref:hypothetical protein n=1 Tax=Leifsonia xyli TaxID=1575 RepID=UPI001186FEB4|nr:hypothetical protein [Leifsonia xyli]